MIHPCSALGEYCFWSYRVLILVVRVVWSVILSCTRSTLSHEACRASIGFYEGNSRQLHDCSCILLLSRLRGDCLGTYLVTVFVRSHPEPSATILKASARLAVHVAGYLRPSLRGFCDAPRTSRECACTRTRAECTNTPSLISRLVALARGRGDVGRRQIRPLPPAHLACLASHAEASCHPHGVMRRVLGAVDPGPCRAHQRDGARTSTRSSGRGGRGCWAPACGGAASAGAAAGSGSDRGLATRRPHELPVGRRRCSCSSRTGSIPTTR